jgi:hypothetical protein
MVSHEAIAGFPTLQTRIEGGLQLSTHNPTLTVVEDFAEVRAELRVGTCANGLSVLANNLTLGVVKDKANLPLTNRISVSRPVTWLTADKDIQSGYEEGASLVRYFFVDAATGEVVYGDTEPSNSVYRVASVLHFQAHKRHFIEVPELLALDELPEILQQFAPKEMHGCTGALLNFARVMAHYLPE